MAETDTFTIGDALPRIRAVSAHEDFQVTVTWEGDARAQRIETVDLAPAIFKFKVYARLRHNPELFRSVRVADGGFALAWIDDEIDMASTTVEDLASQAMTPADFAVFVKRHGYTLESVAAELGISRRQAAYYQGEKAVPRSIALACKYLDLAASSPNTMWPLSSRSNGTTT